MRVVGFGLVLLAVATALGAASPVQAQTQTYPPGRLFRDCADVCPEMMVISARSFMMGSPESVGVADERPQHMVTIPRAFAVGRYEVTFAEWDACVADGGCPEYSGEGSQDSGWGRGRRPVIGVSWRNANLYVFWLSRKTGQTYRLLSEAEWEYAAGLGMRSAYGWGRDTITGDEANFGNQFGRTRPVGAYAPNAFGLYDMHGNVWEWVQDCWHDTYAGAPTDGSAWTSGDCSQRVLRGGAWDSTSGNLRPANRLRVESGGRANIAGFRVARTL